MKKQVDIRWTIFLGLLLSGSVEAQDLTLSLNKTIEIATDSSLDVFRYKNIYLTSYWDYRSYKAARLPSLTMNLIPTEYNRYFTQRYDSENDIDVYRKQQLFHTGANLQIEQNLDCLGGTFFLDTDLDYMRYFGEQTANQFSTVPLRIGYKQSLLGYNAFKWERKIKPLKFEQAKKELIYNMEKMSEDATLYFFSLAMCQMKHELAKENLASSDTLYVIGKERHKIASISQADLLTLKLDVVNARNALKNSEILLKRSMFNLASFLNLDKDTHIILDIPNKPKTMEISADKALELARSNNPIFYDTKRQILEAEQAVDKARKKARFDASISGSIGFNQIANNMKDAYRNLQQQEIVSVRVSVPLVDWGVRRGKYNMARNQLKVIQTSAHQEKVSIEEDVIMTVSDFNIRHQLIKSAEEALQLAVAAYNETKQRFMIGKTDINSLTLSVNRQQEAKQNYIISLQNYWLSYYKIRKLTLFDFEKNLNLSQEFDYKMRGF